MSHSYLDQLRSFHRDIRLFLAASALRSLALLGIHAVLFNLYLLRLGYGAQFVGVANAVGSFAMAAISPLAGALSTRWGGRRVLIFSVSLILIGSALLPATDWLPAALQGGWLLASTVLLQAGRGGYFVSSLPFVMSAAGPRERGYAFSAQVALEPLAAFGGSLIAGLLPQLLSSLLGSSAQETLPYRLALLLIPLLQIPALAALRGTRERPAGQVADTVKLRRKAPWLLIAVMTLVVMLRISALGAVRTFFNVYLDVELQASSTLIGAVSAGAQLLSVPAALLAPALVHRFGRVSSMTLGSLCIALSILPIALVRHWSAAGLGFAGMTALFAMTTGPIREHSQDIVSAEWRGVMSGAVLMGVGLTYALMALVGGYSVAALGYRGVFLAGAGLTAIGALLFWAFFRVSRGELRSAR